MKPNFFCSVDALNILLDMEIENHLSDLEMTVDVIEIPAWVNYFKGENTWNADIYSRGFLYTHETTENALANAEIDRNNYTIQMKAREDFANTAQALALACPRLSAYVQKEQLIEKLWKDNDPDKAGIMLTEKNGTIQAKLVVGRKRPDLMCNQFLAGAEMMRPYMDDLVAASMNDMLPLDMKIERAEEGDEEMMEALAQLYFNGDDETEPDPEQSFYWYEKLAHTGNSIAQYNVGLFYAKGYGTARDYEKAAEWMEKAAENGDPDAPADAENYRMMAAAEASAAEGDAEAQAVLARGLMTLGGMNLPGFVHDYAECIEMAEKSAAQDNGDGIWILALAYSHGRGVEKDDEKAIELFRRGAELNHASCQHNLGCEYINGVNLPKDESMAFDLFMKAAAQGSGLAMRDLGKCYQFGQGVECDMKKAIEWYERALEIIDDPDLAMKVQIFKTLPSVDEDFDEDFDEDTDDAYELPAGYMAALEKMNNDFKMDGDTFVKYNGSAAHVNLPYNLRAIAARAFMFSDELVSVNITPKIETIGEKAFMGCHKLETVTLPETLREIHDFGFANCENIQAIELPQGLTKIGECAFINCEGIRSLIIPEGIKEIASCAFQNCSALERIVLPEGLTKIGQESFAECYALKEMNIPGSLASVGHDAFRGCDLLPNPPAVTEEMAAPDAGEMDAFLKMLFGLGGNE